MSDKPDVDYWKSLWNAKMPRREMVKFLAIGGIATMVTACLPGSTGATLMSVMPIGVTAQTRPDITLTPKSSGLLGAVTYAQLPRWCGFNLLEKFNYDSPDSNKPYVKEDLEFIAEWGFNFIRLPMDYRIWTISPGVYQEQPLKDIDQVIGWARQLGIHVNLCLHRAPGYCVNPPEEPLNLWATGLDGEEARLQFAEQWRMFAVRYRGIPAAELSFDLVNEPPNLSGEQYAQAIIPAIEAIRQEDPHRLIIVDGVNYGKQPVPELVPLKVAQSTRGYEPFPISHYHASWIGGADQWPVPTWPILVMINQFLYGDWKPEFKSSLILTGNFSDYAQFSIRVQQVSNNAELVIRANGTTIFQKVFQPGPGEGEWKESIFREEWNDYLGLYDIEYTASLPTNTHEIEVEVVKGDWLTISELSVEPLPSLPTQKLEVRSGDSRWGIRQEPILLNAEGNLSLASQKPYYSRETLWTNDVEPWETFSIQHGIGVHVGEWGVLNQTPHTVALAWMKDCLDNWKQSGMGWALWNLRGSFGVMDSGRADVIYENYLGHKLDRKMLELLREGSDATKFLFVPIICNQK